MQNHSLTTTLSNKEYIEFAEALITFRAHLYLAWASDMVKGAREVVRRVADLTTGRRAHLPPRTFVLTYEEAGELMGAAHALRTYSDTATDLNQSTTSALATIIYVCRIAGADERQIAAE